MKDQYLISKKNKNGNKIIHITSRFKFTITTIALSCLISSINLVISFLHSIERLILQGPNCLIQICQNIQNKLKSFLYVYL